MIGIEKLVRVPRGRERTGFRFAIADHARDDEIGVVEDGAERMAQRVAELAAFVDAAGRFRRDVARNAAGKRELLEQDLEPGLVARDGRVDLAVGAFEIRVRDERRPAMTRARDVDHVEVVLV